MKFVIRPYSTPDWMQKYLPGMNTLSLSICNKYLIEYYFDLLYQLKVKEVLVLVPEYQKEIFDYYDRQSEWGLKIRVEIALDDEQYSSIENRYSNFFSGEDYGIIEDAIFIEFDQHNSDFIRSLASRKSLKFSVKENSALKVKPLDSIESYFNKSVELIKFEDIKYNLPGFGFENGGYVGKGVSLKNKDSISRKVHIGDYVLVDKDALIKQGAIIGDHVVIESSAEVENCVVNEKTVLGKGIFLKDKIVYGNKIICPRSGEIAEVDERILLPLLDKKNYSDIILYQVQFLCSLFFIIYSLPAYLFFRFYSLFSNSNIFVKRSIRFSKWNSRSVVVFDIEKLKMRSKQRKFAELFFLPHFHEFIAVLKGEMNLIGASRESFEKRGIVNGFTSVFTFSSLCKDPDLQDYKEVYDYFYMFQPSVILHIYALFKIAFSRILFLVR